VCVCVCVCVRRLCVCVFVCMCLYGIRRRRAGESVHLSVFRKKFKRQITTESNMKITVWLSFEKFYRRELAKAMRAFPNI